MIFTERDVVPSFGLLVGRDVKVRFLVDTDCPNSITLVIGDSVAEISFDPATVELLGDKARDAVRELRAGGVGDRTS
ncbi:hypothetical protein F4560_007190 [Saccharothrix ecbatanensis]|uniref:Uncharacterized protein n=1 Tax=Saccharothrix ecbatanensis TaxID=1105145 RepID=A0A7W9HS06_9PSEU|nr:hypothetical protein [Saccharothrix ecbatanensis]MBB5807422.1 hypothetical protein [Saccharothrix ecbatanensis]